MNKSDLTSAEWHRRFLVQELWTSELRKYIYTKCDLPESAKILEVGCGTGAVLSQIPVRNAKIYGIDIFFPHLRFCQNVVPQAALTSGDGLALPFPDKQFDMVYCHFLLLWVGNPQAALAEMVRITKPGRYVCLFAEPDYGGRIDYPPALEALGDAQTKSLQHQGADPFVGRTLKELAHSAGIHMLETGVLNNASNANFSLPHWESEWQMYRHDLSGIFSEREVDALQHQDKEAWLSGIRTLYVPTFYLWGHVSE